MGIITREVRVNIGIATVNGDVPVAIGDAILVAGLAAGCDLDWLILRRFESLLQARGSQKNKKQASLTRVRIARSKGIAEETCCNGKWVQSCRRCFCSFRWN